MASTDRLLTIQSLQMSKLHIFGRKWSMSQSATSPESMISSRTTQSRGESSSGCWDDHCSRTCWLSAISKIQVNPASRKQAHTVQEQVQCETEEAINAYLVRSMIISASSYLCLLASIFHIFHRHRCQATHALLRRLPRSLELQVK